MMGNYHVPFCRAVGEVTLLLTLILENWKVNADGLSVNACGQEVADDLG